MDCPGRRSRKPHEREVALSAIGPRSELCLFASMERARCLAVLFTCLCMQSLLAQATQPAAVFKTALDDIHGKNAHPNHAAFEVTISNSRERYQIGARRSAGGRIFHIALLRGNRKQRELRSRVRRLHTHASCDRTAEHPHRSINARSHWGIQPCFVRKLVAPANLWWEQRGYFIKSR